MEQQEKDNAGAGGTDSHSAQKRGLGPLELLNLHLRSLVQSQVSDFRSYIDKCVPSALGWNDVKDGQRELGN